MREGRKGIIHKHNVCANLLCMIALRETQRVISKIIITQRSQHHLSPEQREGTVSRPP